MYSMVLMLAMSGTADVPAFGHGCRGCWGGNGCSGGYAYGCSGGYGYGCSGGYGYGCSGSYGYGCSGGYGYGCSGGYRHGCHGCHGGYQTGGWGCCGGMPVAPSDVAPSMPEPAPAPKPAAAVPAPAQILVRLPADATLTIDDQPTRSTSDQRLFFSPPLDVGKEYTYTLRAEVMRDGQPVASTRQITVRPGELTRVEFDLPVAVSARR
jgi:uncharacterized protein (TIGR03000 family)